jgi:hypothetical protein
VHAPIGRLFPDIQTVDPSLHFTGVSAFSCQLDDAEIAAVALESDPACQNC